jgi:hypothetical protein
MLASESATQYLNVDLDVWSSQSLEPLVAALGERVCVHYVGREGRRHGAHVSLARTSRSADATARALARLIETLPQPARRLWDTASARDFNIGIQAGLTPHAHEVRLSATTLEIIARLGGRIVVTTYSPEERILIAWRHDASRNAEEGRT